MDTLSSYGNSKLNKRSKKLLLSKLGIPKKKVEMIRNILKKYPQRNSDDFKQEINFLPIPKKLKERIIFFEENKKDIQEIKDIFEIKNKLVIK